MSDKQTTDTWRIFTEGWGEGPIKPRPPDTPHPFRGKVVDDICPIGSWWRKGWVIYFTDGTYFSTHPRLSKSWRNF